MRSIGEVRQLRLKQFIDQTGMSYADVNERLGRNRRDATLNQVAKAAKNTSTGKPRRMGDTQARLLETTFKLPDGWFDTDPAGRPDFVSIDAAGHITVIEAKSIPASKSQATARLAVEEPSVYTWPFETVKLADIKALTTESRAAMERVMLAFMGTSKALPDWRPIAFKLAADLDHSNGSDVFTMFVRAIEVELKRPATSATDKAHQ